jgi:hypothetical protein
MTYLTEGLETSGSEENCKRVCPCVRVCVCLCVYVWESHSWHTGGNVCNGWNLGANLCGTSNLLHSKWDRIFHPEGKLSVKARLIALMEILRFNKPVKSMACPRSTFFAKNSQIFFLSPSLFWLRLDLWSILPFIPNFWARFFSGFSYALLGLELSDSSHKPAHSLLRHSLKPKTCDLWRKNQKSKIIHHPSNVKRQTSDLRLETSTDQDAQEQILEFSNSRIQKIFFFRECFSSWATKPFISRDAKLPGFFISAAIQRFEIFLRRKGRNLNKKRTKIEEKLFLLAEKNRFFLNFRTRHWSSARTSSSVTSFVVPVQEKQGEGKNQDHEKNPSSEWSRLLDRLWKFRKKNFSWKTWIFLRIFLRISRFEIL